MTGVPIIATRRWRETIATRRWRETTATRRWRETTAARRWRETTAARVLRGAAAIALVALASACMKPRLETGYAALEDWYVSQGLLRTEYAPPDAPFTRADLVRNFAKIAFHSEYAPGATLVQRETGTELFKWSGALRWSLAGDGAGPTDLLQMRALVARLGALTGLTFVELAPEADAAPDVTMLILGQAMRDEALAAMMRATGRPSAPLVEAWSRQDRFPCVGQIRLLNRSGGPGRLEGFIFIKAETSRLLRQSCLHEEFTQVLGLLNDGDDVRPSIFNDGQEFALLTRHDEMLLRILYDPRLKTGMTEAVGMPIVRRIVAQMDITQGGGGRTRP